MPKTWMAGASPAMTMSVNLVFMSVHYPKPGKTRLLIAAVAVAVAAGSQEDDLSHLVLQ